MRNEQLYQAFYEVRGKLQRCTQENVKRIINEQEMLDADLEKLREVFDLWSKELSTREALLEQEKQKLDEDKRKNDMQSMSSHIEEKKLLESALKIVEEEKREKEMALKKVVELEGKLNEKQREIVELKANKPQSVGNLRFPPLMVNHYTSS